MATYIKPPNLSWSAIFLIISLLGCVCEARVYRDKRNTFVRIKKSHFVINGSPFLFNGFNAYWMMNVATEPSERYKVSQVLQDAASAGLSVCRTWAFGDGGGGDRVLQISPGVYDERVFQGLDFVVAEARKYGIRLILSFVNNYKDFGGRSQYVGWARNSGVQISSDDDFYTNPIVQGYYKNHVQRVITRINTITNIAYSNDSTIMAWELMNEPRCQADYSGRMINVSDFNYVNETILEVHKFEFMLLFK
ncbi:mannan endo-1,4-beta-mannosidase 5-like [Bidens hawaiensis]|uniref:mannan endo-1,4-beta-mannosidase 5-like n=1 Tax=Bidens hawaiensis TaxID=980011 RepID=UPI00404AF352